MDQTKMENPKNDLDAFTQGEAEAEARGGDHRPVQDNGTVGRTSNVQGQNTFRGDYALPKDPHQPPGYDPDSNQADRQDYGLNESVEVAQQGNQLQYGVEGPAAGGGISKNTKT